MHLIGYQRVIAASKFDAHHGWLCVQGDVVCVCVRIT